MVMELCPCPVVVFRAFLVDLLVVKRAMVVAGISVIVISRIFSMMVGCMYTQQMRVA